MNQAIGIDKQVMSEGIPVFDEVKVLNNLRHYLPAQAPLKDFIHHNTLHAFQDLSFYDALRSASEIFGYKVSLMLSEYKELHRRGAIKHEILDKVIIKHKGMELLRQWRVKVLTGIYESTRTPRIGSLRSLWKRDYHIDMDSLVHPLLFRSLCSYLDQGISVWKFPARNKPFLSAVRRMERYSYTGFFHSSRARDLLLNTKCDLADLLKIIVGDESRYEQYLFDLQFAHQGWSGIVATIESNPESLFDQRQITLKDVIAFELLLEIDALDTHFGDIWSPLALRAVGKVQPLFDPVEKSELSEVLTIWQDAFEQSYYDEILSGIARNFQQDQPAKKTFQAIFCIDDRECGLRRYIEQSDPQCETFGTPGFFSVEFYFQPENGKFKDKLCPAPVNPAHLIKEVGSGSKHTKDLYFSKHSHSFYGGWLLSQTIGFWSAMKLTLNIFRPSSGPGASSSFRHMDPGSKLTIENKSGESEDGLQIGFTVSEMADRVERLLRSIGMVANFAPVVYVIGHGSSSINNPHYAAYDCGACSGRAGSVNSRVICFMANHIGVRQILRERGIDIPGDTTFLGGLHDTTRDEIAFYDDDSLSGISRETHQNAVKVLLQSLDLNAKERSRRLESVRTSDSLSRIHKKLKSRSVSLFEPRPELNHATNALCVIGRRMVTKGLFLDRRAFLNSYDYRLDPNGDWLFPVIRPIAPVCGGINLEYFFSRVDKQKLGAGSKLPHNVMGLFGVANGIDGDLRPGLPTQMTEVHDPVRLLLVVEHFPEIILDVIKRDESLYQWFANEWIHLVSFNPETREFFWFKNGEFVDYNPNTFSIPTIDSLDRVFERAKDNLPVYLIKH